jgi:hypothetical protein
MNRVKRNVVISLILGVMSVLAIGVSHLALTDIWHGEADVSLEWTVLRLAALVIIVFHVSAFASMWQVLRRDREA